MRDQPGIFKVVGRFVVGNTWFATLLVLVGSKFFQ